MTATDELRRLLDERGVEWDKGAYPNEARTYWRDTVAKPWDEQRLFVMALLTPEQAIEATLGRTCECDASIPWTWNAPVKIYEHELSCGHVITSTEPVPPKYCEECGARVLEPSSNLLGGEEEE